MHANDARLPDAPEEPNSHDTESLMNRRDFLRMTAKATAGAAGIVLTQAGCNTRPVTAPVKAEASERLTDEQVQAHIDDQLENGGVQIVTLEKAMDKEHVGCGDGRRKTPVAGVFGGSTGRLIEEGDALEVVTGKPLEKEEIDMLVDKRAKKIGGLHLHTDLAHGINHLAKHLQTDPKKVNTLLRDPGENFDAVLNALLDPKCIACGDLRNKLTNPKAYPGLDNEHLRADLVEGILKAVYSTMLRSPDDVNYEIIDEPEHRERGILMVTGSAQHPHDKVPLVTPNWNGTQLFVMTEDVAQALDVSFAHNVKDLTGRTVKPDELLRCMRKQGPEFLRATAEAVKVNGVPASKLPMFIGQFDEKTGRISVRNA